MVAWGKMEDLRYDDEADYSNLKSFFHKSQRKHNDKSDRATSEQVLDPRTRTILSKFLRNGQLSQINGCISTGKEANVYQAVSGEEPKTSVAIKIYKTSILIFKDRDRYVTGEYRFRHGYCRSNPRKMVKMWAEKEMRNLKRLYAVGIPCPQPILLKLHILVMSFIGDSVNEIPAPRLKDAQLSEQEAKRLYWELVLTVRKMYHECRLVHADLSEYNLLYFESKIWIIDVGQAVEHDHPHSFDFLRHDCTNITNFFKTRGVRTLTVREFFDFVTNITFGAERNTPKDYVERMSQEIQMRSADFEQQIQIDEEVFKRAFIPKRLEEVIDAERDLSRIADGEVEEILYEKITGIKLHSSDDDDDEDLSDISSYESDSVDSADDETITESMKTMSVSPEQTKLLAKAQRKLNKKQVKMENRERRKNKMPKALKAKLTKRRHKK